jgi:hypothetical protein
MVRLKKKYIYARQPAPILLWYAWYAWYAYFWCPLPFVLFSSLVKNKTFIRGGIYVQNTRTTRTAPERRMNKGIEGRKQILCQCTTRTAPLSLMNQGVEGNTNDDF